MSEAKKLEEKQTLQTLVAQANYLAEALVESGGEITPDIEALLQVNEKDLAVKVDSYAVVMDRFDMEIEYFKKKAEEFTAARRIMESAKERLRENVKFALKTLKLTEISGQDYKFRLQKSKPKLIIDEKLLPQSYLTQTISYSANKEMIQDALEAGLDVPGANLLEVSALRKVVAKGSK